MGNNWVKLALSDMQTDELFESLQTYQSLIATLSGLISGFSYVVLSQESIDYDVQNFIGFDRSDVTAGFITFAFFTSMAALGLEATLYFYGGFGGKDNVKNWLQQSGKFVNIPVFFLVFAIGLMLAGSFIHIGGFYSDILYYLIIAFTGLFFALYLWLQANLMGNQFDYLDEMQFENENKFEMQNRYEPPYKMLPALQTASN